VAESTEVIGARPERGAWLYISNGPQAGRDFRLGRRTTIGRNRMECDVVLSDKKVSEKHARIQREGREFVIYDLASRNGTFVNEKKVQKRLLGDDDEITVGGTTMIFKVTPKPPLR
jgi:pSer/pThr/pTyr-binding forkhead associated (FHA) protein